MYWMQKVLKRNLSSIPSYDIERERGGEGESQGVWRWGDGMGGSMDSIKTHKEALPNELCSPGLLQ